MPIYEYRCEECGEVFEKLQKITEKPIKKCVHCGGPAHRIISQSTFILKGTGWYATDYPSSDRKRGISKEKSSTDSSSTTSSSSTTDSSKKKTKKASDKSKVAA